MRKSRWFAAAALVLIGLSFGTVPRTPQSLASPAPNTEQASFRGKVFLICTSYGREAHILEQVRVRQLASQAFLLGKVIESTGSGDTLKGKTLWLNMMGITQIIECADVVGAKKTLKSLQQGGYGPVPLGPVIETTPGVPTAPSEELALPRPSLPDSK